MAALGGRNPQSDQIVRVACVFLRVIVGPLIMQGDVGTSCYLLHRLLGPQFPLVKALQLHVFNALDEDLASLLLQM